MNIVNDWLFIDYHDRINVLVEDPNSTSNEPNFLVFKQTKYSLENRESLAIVGGIIEPGEAALQAAKREVEEEMNGIQCNNIIELGRYRTDVNRGIGWVNSFLFRDCSKKAKPAAETNSKDEVGEHDVERQDLMSLPLSQLKQRAMNGEFLEVQWSLTVSLALLHL